MDITVVGAGVIGLTSALALERAGHTVRVVAAALDQETTSAIAGAVWFPYRAGPPDRVAIWAATTRRWLDALADDPATGVDRLTGFEITGDAALPWWAAAIDVERAPAPVTGSPLAWRFAAPRAQPSLFLPYLTRQLRASIERRVVTSLEREPGDVVVNCTGLGARTLIGDDALVPLRGQIELAAPGGVDLRVTITDDRDPENIFYVIPRRDQLVVGGCSIPTVANAPLVADPTIRARIVGQASALGVPIGEIIDERVGLRPYRPSVRLERDGRVVHNYGHGGAGFTLCHGCALDVVALVER